MIKKLHNKLNGNMHFKEILAGSAVTFVLKISGLLLGYAVMFIISRQHGAEGIGIYNLSLSVLTFVGIVAMMGTNSSILRYAGQFNHKGSLHKLKLLYRYTLELVIPFSLLLGMVFFFRSEWIAKDVFQNQNYTLALQLIALMLPFFALLQISVEFIRGLKQLKISEYLRSVNRSLFNLALLSIGGLFITNILLPLYTLGISIVAGSIYAFYFIAKHLSKITTSQKKDFSKKELIHTSLPMMITAIASFVINNVSLLFLEIYATTEEVGIFSVAFKISILISIVLMIVNTIAAPKFSELFWSNRQDELQKVIDFSSRLIFGSALFLAVIIIVFKQFILSLFGNQFIQGDIVLVLLVTGQMINAMTGSTGIFLNMTGHQKTLQHLSILGMILTLGLSYILIPKYGMYGACIAFIVGISIKYIFATWYVQAKHGFKTYYVPFYTRS